MPKNISIARLERRCDPEGKTLYFMIPSTTRRSPPKFIRPEHMCEPDGPGGWFEIETIYAKPRAIRKAIRRVEKPSWA